MKILTIVVPAYNVQKYLNKCLDSFIVEEILEELEIIIINDGSKDNTAEIAATYTSRYPKTFMLINKTNGGHGSTINTGIRYANGKYFKIVDGDDWIDKLELIHLINDLKISDSDLIANNYNIVKENNGSSVKVNVCMNNKVKNYSMAMNECFFSMQSFNIKTDILKKNKICIDENSFYVDMEFILYPIPYINKIECSDACVYQYRVGTSTQSVSNAGWYKNRLNHKNVTLKLVAFYSQCKRSNINELKLNYIKKSVLKMVIAHYRVYTRFSQNIEQLRSEIKNFDQELLGLSIELYRISERDMIVWLLRKSDFILLKIIHNIRNIYKCIKGEPQNG